MMVFVSESLQMATGLFPKRETRLEVIVGQPRSRAVRGSARREEDALGLGHLANSGLGTNLPAFDPGRTSKQRFHAEDGAPEQHAPQHRAPRHPPRVPRPQRKGQRQGERIRLHPGGHVLLRHFLDRDHAGLHEIQAAGEEGQPAAAVQGRGAAVGRGHEAPAHDGGAAVGAGARRDAEHAAGERGARAVLHALLHGGGQRELRVLLARRAPHHPGGGGRRRAGGGELGDAPERKQRGLLGEHPPEFLAPPGPPAVALSAERKGVWFHFCSEAASLKRPLGRPLRGDGGSTGVRAVPVVRTATAKALKTCRGAHLLGARGSGAGSESGRSRCLLSVFSLDALANSGSFCPLPGTCWDTNF